MTVYQHDCNNCIFLGSDTLHEQPADIYYCEKEEPYPTIIVRTGNENHQYSSLDVKSLLRMARNPGTKTIQLMIKYYKQLTIEQARILH